MDDWKAAQYAAASVTNKELMDCIKGYEYDKAEGFALDETDHILHKANLEERDRRIKMGLM